MVTLDELTRSVSPHRLETAQRCLAMFAFRYLERLPERWRSALSFGRAVDEAGNETYEEKRRTEQTPSAREVQERFAAAWDFASEGVDEWQDGETKGSLLDKGTRAMALWRERIALHVHPLAVQERLEIAVRDPATGDPFSLNGVVDLRYQQLAHGDPERIWRPAIADLKTAGRAYRADEILRRAQPPAYALLTGVSTFEYHVLTIGTKEPQTQVLRAQIPAGDREAFLRRAGMIRRQIAHAHATGDWLPNRTHQLCSRRYCEFWAACERRHGGKVPS